MIDNGIGGHHFLANNATFAVNTHADLHFFSADFEIVAPCLGQGTGLQRNAHRKGSSVGLARHRFACLERHAAVTRCTGCLEDEEISRYAAPTVAILHWGRRYIVCCQNGPCGNASFLRHFGRHLEIHDIPDIVAIDEEDAFAGGGLGAFENWGRGRRGKDIPDGYRIGKPFSDIAQKTRFMPGPAANHQSYFSCRGPVRATSARFDPLIGAR